MKKKLKKFLLILIFEIILVVISIYGTYIYIFHNSKYYDLVKYEEKLLHINLETYVENVDGYIILDESEYAIAKFQVKEGHEEDVLSLFDEEFGERIIPNSPSFIKPNDFYAIEINKKKPQYMYELLLPGTRGQMTRDVRIFIVNEEDGFMYIYFFG